LRLNPIDFRRKSYETQVVTLAGSHLFLNWRAQSSLCTRSKLLPDPGTSAYSLNIIRGTGSLFIGLAFVFWFARNAEASKARDAIFLGNAVGFFINVIFVVISALTPDGVVMTWGIAVINLLFAIGFFVVGRANMSTNTSLAGRFVSENPTGG
jgi:hypothetical protein